MLVAYGGVALLVGAERPGGSASLAGDAIVFVSAVLLAERTVYLARAVQRLDPVKLLLAQAAVGIALLAGLSTVLESEPTRWTLSLATSLAYQGVLIAGFCFVANLWLLKRYRPSVLAAFFLTQPVFGVIAAALFTGDPLTWELLAACAAVVAGIGLSTRGGRHV